MGFFMITSEVLQWDAAAPIFWSAVEACVWCVRSWSRFVYYHLKSVHRRNNDREHHRGSLSNAKDSLLYVGEAAPLPCGYFYLDAFPKKKLLSSPFSFQMKWDKAINRWVRYLKVVVWIFCANSCPYKLFLMYPRRHHSFVLWHSGDFACCFHHPTDHCGCIHRVTELSMPAEN